MNGIPSHWRWVTLNELQAEEPRAITDGPFGSNLTSAHYTDSGPRVVRLQNIGDGEFVDARSHISPEHFARLQTHQVLPGDLLIASLGDSPPRACIAPGWLGPAIVKADCIRVRLSPAVEPRWVLYALQAPTTRHWAAEKTYGVGRPRLGMTTIRAIPIPLPPLREQRRIIEILEDHLSRLDTADQLVLMAERRIASWQKWSVDALVQTNSSATGTLADLVLRVEAGKSFGGSAPPATDDQWGVIKVSAMTWGRFKPEENKAVSGERIDPRFEIRPGDVLVSRANTTEYVGAPVLVESTPSRLLLSDKSLRLVPRGDLDPRWLVQVLASPSTRRQISARATGTKDSMRNISQAALLTVRAPRATSPQQQLVISRAEAVGDAANAARTALETSKVRAMQLRRALLQAAFIGQLTGGSPERIPYEEMARV